MTSLASRPRLRILAIVALLLVPLAVVGLFVGALSGVGSGQSRVPAAIVNEDQMVEQTAADGTTTPVLAGRLLVTELTSSDPVTGAANAFDWQITSADKAGDALASGQVYAVLTIPKDFSASIVSLSTPDPKRGTIAVRTDDAHGYLAGTLTDAAGDGLAAIFGNGISEQFIAGLVGKSAQIQDGFTQAASGATDLQSGAQALSSGLTQLGQASDQTQAGAASLASGIDQYVGGVSSLSAGLSDLSDATEGLQQLPQGTTDYTNGVSDLSTALAGVVAQLNAQVQAQPDPTVPIPLDPAVLEQLNGISAQLNGVAQAGPTLVSGAQGAASAQRAIAQSATGAASLASSGSTVSGAAGSLSSALTQLTTGINSSATGAGQLADGAGTLATGLNDGAAKVPVYTTEQTTQIADVASSPIALTSTRSHEMGNVPAVATTLLIPVGLWIGAFVAFLALGLLTRRVFASTASNLRITLYALTRAGAIVLAQAVLLVAFLHLVVRVPWTAAPATLPFALLIAVVFTCIHAFLSAAFERWGLIVSFLLLAVQLTATGGLYPIELLPQPFQVISPFLPLTQAVNGMQAILAGVGPEAVIGMAIPLAIWGLVAAALTVFAVSRKRSARYLGLAAAPPAPPAKVRAHLAA